MWALRSPSVDIAAVAAGAAEEIEDKASNAKAMSLAD